jgi:hypothetical protein
MDMQENSATGLITLFNLELDSKQMDHSFIKEHTSTIKKFNIVPKDLEKCFMWLKKLSLN